MQQAIDKFCKLVQYADDTLVFHAENLQKVLEPVEINVENVTTKFDCPRLNIHLDKTIVFVRRQK